jgi:hypothetical protein
MSDTENNSLREITIQGTELSLEVPYAEGHVLTATEASQLNQVFCENIGNNFRSKVKEMLEAGQSAEDIQAAFDAYVEVYEFGSRRVSSGTKRTADPIEKEARALAKRALTEFFRKKEIDFSSLSVDEKDQALRTYMEKHGAKVREIAARRVADQKAMAEAGL